MKDRKDRRSEGSQISLRESSTSPVDLEIYEDADDSNTNTNFDVTPEKIKENFCCSLRQKSPQSLFAYRAESILSSEETGIIMVILLT